MAAAPIFVDIGVNLLDQSFEADREQVLERAREAGVMRLVLTGTDVDRSRKSADLAATRRGLLYATAGIHPHHASDFDAGSIDQLRELACRPEVVAVGETGLDFFRDLSPRDAQIRCFEAQLALAAELDLPVFVHERDAGDTLAAILRERRSELGAVVVHCFTGERATLEKYLELDLHIGITGWICDERRGTHLLPLVPTIPRDRLMLETDAPYLLPRTIKPRPKSRRNEPANLVYVACTVAEATGESLEELAARTTTTAESFFRIG